MIVYIYNIGVDLYNGFNGLRHRIDWTYFTVLDGLAHPLYSIIEENEFKLLSIEVIYMNAKDMGVFICKLRKENNMKQMEWAEKIHVTDKAISRWKRGIGFLDIQLLPSLTKLISCKKSSYYSNEEVTILFAI